MDARKILQYFLLPGLLFSSNAFAQVPGITYNTPVNVYTVGTAITSLTPVNAGGAVPATTYAQVTTLIASGTINSPFAITTDAAGNVYVADNGNNKVRKITPAGVMTTLAGSGAAAEVDGTGATAALNGPDGLAYDGAGNLYVADAAGNTIRKIVIATGAVTTYAGSGATGHANGATLLTSTFNGPDGLDIDAAGNLYIADFTNNLVREISGGVVSTLAGGGSVGGIVSGSANGTGVAATFNQPIDLVDDGKGNLFVADYTNNTIRKINIATKAVTTFAGSGTAAFLDATGTAAEFSAPASLCFDASGNLLVADQNNSRIRMITPGAVVTTVAGSGTSAETNGTGPTAAFALPVGITVDSQGNYYIADWPTVTTGTVRKMLVTGYAISPALPAGLAFASATGIISGNPTASSAATNYTITGYNISGSSSAVISIAVGTSAVWTGNVSATWASGTNWNTGVAPATNDAVSIGVSAYTGSKKEPLITTAVTVGSITFGNSGGSHTLTVTSPGALTIGGYLTVPTAVTPTVTGTGAINIAPGAIVNVNGTGVLTITSPLSFTLMSNAISSASVGQVLTTSIAGTGADSIRVQRYVSGGAGYRGYRLMSSPVYAATVSSNNVYSLNYLHDHLFLTGTGGTANGFDKAGNPTIYLFREDQAPSNATFTSGNFWGTSNLVVSSTTHNNDSYYLNGGSTAYNLPAGNGFMLFFRGDRTTVNPYVPSTTPVAATVIETGTLNTGQVVVHNWYSPASANLGWTNATPNGTVRGFNLVGNPYASSIDWEQYNTASTTTGIYANNVSNTIYELNPATNNYDTYQKGGSFTNHGRRTIVSGQGFFVVASNNSSPQLVFNESAKSVTQNTGLNLFMATSTDLAAINSANIDRHLRLQMAKDSVNTDDVYIGFERSASSQYVFNEDAPYKPGSGAVGIATISSDNVNLAINKLPLPGLNQTNIPLVVAARVKGAYNLNMVELKGISSLYEIWLMDRYTNDSLDMRHNTTYAFDITADTNSYGSKRFQLIIRQDPALALHLLNFAATKQASGAETIWKTENDGNYTNFTVERSIDKGVYYTVLGGFASDASGAYSLLDKNPVPGKDQYRLKMEDLNGNITYSNMVTLIYGNSNILASNNISVYPNPAKNTLNLAIKPAFNTNNTSLQLDNINNPKTTAVITAYTINIVNSSGAVIKTAITSGQNWQADITGFVPGAYVMQVVNNSDHSLVGKSTFVKL